MKHATKMILEDQNIQNSVDLHRPKKMILRNDFRIPTPPQKSPMVRRASEASSFDSELCMVGVPSSSRFPNPPEKSTKYIKDHQSTGPFSQMFFPVQKWDLLSSSA